MDTIEVTEVKFDRYVAFAISDDMIAPLADMQCVYFCEPHMAVDTTATVPTAVRLVAVVHLHGNDIIFLKIRREVIAERTVAVRAGAEPMTIDPHRSVHINAIEIDEELLSVFYICLEMLTVPADTAWQGAATCSRRITYGEVALDSPVVWEIEKTPTAVIDILLIQSCV